VRQQNQKIKAPKKEHGQLNKNLLEPTAKFT